MTGVGAEHRSAMQGNAPIHCGVAGLHREPLGQETKESAEHSSRALANEAFTSWSRQTDEFGSVYPADNSVAVLARGWQGQSVHAASHP